MVIKNELIYKPSIKVLEKEEDVITLIREVNSDLSKLGYCNLLISLKKVLKTIESGKYEFQREDSIVDSVDLSKAKNLIETYKRFSEGGCQSCKKMSHYMPFPDEHVNYCSKFENKEIVESGFSPRINQFYKTGCEVKEPIFKKSLDKLLEESEDK